MSGGDLAKRWRSGSMARGSVELGEEGGGITDRLLAQGDIQRGVSNHGHRGTGHAMAGAVDEGDEKAVWRLANNVRIATDDVSR